jgi:hypothetical protein
MLKTIVIPFNLTASGRVIFPVDVMTGNGKSFNRINFLLDSGSDFTTISHNELLKLGYTQEFLDSCLYHKTIASTASEARVLKLQYIDNISIKFGDRELQGCRIFFANRTRLRSLFGNNILKYFNREINYDKRELRLEKTAVLPLLSADEGAVHIYEVDS